MIIKISSVIWNNKLEFRTKRQDLALSKHRFNKKITQRENTKPRDVLKTKFV